MTPFTSIIIHTNISITIAVRYTFISQEKEVVDRVIFIFSLRSFFNQRSELSIEKKYRKITEKTKRKYLCWNLFISSLQLRSRGTLLCIWVFQISIFAAGQRLKFIYRKKIWTCPIIFQEVVKNFMRFYNMHHPLHFIEYHMFEIIHLLRSQNFPKN